MKSSPVIVPERVSVGEIVKIMLMISMNALMISARIMELAKMKLANLSVSVKMVGKGKLVRLFEQNLVSK